MKRSIRAAALVLAVSMLLTACSGTSGTGGTSDTGSTSSSGGTGDTGGAGGTGGASGKNDYTEYLNAAVTEVEDELFVINDKPGVYYGEWKGNRPEGSGTLYLSETEYYSGQWENGYMIGEGEFCIVENGFTKLYTGECEYSRPSGEGQMRVSADGDGHYILTCGDFSDTSSLLIFAFDEKDHLYDVGAYSDNYEYISFVNDPDSHNDPRGKTDFLLTNVGAGSVGGNTKGRKSFYVGQLNENGLPDGYGYYTDSYEGDSYAVLGSWKNGTIRGYFIEGWTETTQTGKGVHKNEGTVKDGKLVENKSYKKYTSGTSGVFMETYDEDTSIRVVDKRPATGNHTIETLHLMSEASANAGTYYEYDQNENLIKHRELQHGKWVTLTDLEKEAQEARLKRIQTIVEIGAPVALVGFYGLSTMDPDFHQWFVDYDADLAARGAAFDENQKIRRGLLEEAKDAAEKASRETGATRDRLLNDADNLRREAEKHNITPY